MKQSDISNQEKNSVAKTAQRENEAKVETKSTSADTQVGDNAIKDPDDWTTGDEPMTGAQRSYLHTLASEAGEEVEENLTKAAASKKIDELQHKTGRGLQHDEAR